MRFFLSLKCCFLIVVTVLLSACATIPPELTSSDTSLVTSYKVWKTGISDGREIRLGGVIATVENLKDKTRLEIVNVPLTGSGKPDINVEPEGRFIAYIKGFMDPVTLSKGRLISVLGQTAGTEVARVGQYQGTFPVMNVTGFHLWRIENQVIINHFGSYLRPCRTLSCHEDDLERGRVIQVVK
ncbi:Slp family lipoprotein [Vibrio salinus]|uniref:Slp family lipoprotein n=1 Tax=Vibrio salinus TaxID=2899784 RepID=UPI001E5B0244|nr:Slp family lipoprotein [Vibrio salinus]MCE0492911.1 Slp family lipoprotein [Vibrio salinus]